MQCIKRTIAENSAFIFQCFQGFLNFCFICQITMEHIDLISCKRVPENIKICQRMQDLGACWRHVFAFILIRRNESKSCSGRKKRIRQPFCRYFRIAKQAVVFMLQYSIDQNNNQTGNVSVNHLYAVKKKAGLRELINHHKEYLLLKRSIDIMISLAVLLFLLSWLVPLIGLLIRLDSPGPVLFVQKRIGRYGRPFWCLKFRTMVMNAESDQKAAVENDSRITRIGRLLRLSNIDEFPQFINVLTGSMSIVGPRPHMLTDCGKFSEIQPGYKFRNLVKPGLTGLAQVKGYHGPARSIESITLRFFWDKQYIYRFSLMLDIKIILQTMLQYLGALFSPGISKSVPKHFWHHS